MRFKRRVHVEKGHLDIAPLIDCIFLLLIFFLLTSNFIFQPGIKINLPKAVTSEVVQENTLVITVTSDNRFYLNEAPITFVELKSKLKGMSSNQKPILIKADRDVALGKVVNIWDFCRDIGVTQINIATNQEVR
ncbi:MAG: biopolymer transporter ExbD [Candidatus Omnitrophica bacterium]|nr:biopolymer transporter ExbD [Candidatus Omnitrophota bacterium]MBU1852474.1 biopolymer transporter ExbD [Candidatus Omnitrophota bacterium]